MSDAKSKHTKNQHGVAVITGAYRGLGFEASRQLGKKGISIVLTARNEAKAKEAAERLAKEGATVEARVLDVSDSKSIDQFVQKLRDEGASVDILINNAGIMIDDENGDVSFLKTGRETLRQTMETNVYGALELIQKLAPLMSRQGRIVNVSSGMGQLSDMGGGWPAYRISKTAINAVTRIAAAELKERGIKVNSVSPGWARTEMGGESAPLSAEEGARTMVWLATLPDNGPSGEFFDEDQDRMEW